MRLSSSSLIYRNMPNKCIKSVPARWASTGRPFQAAAYANVMHYCRRSECFPKRLYCELLGPPTDSQRSRRCIERDSASRLSEFQDHEGFDGVILGHPKGRYHLEFTHHRGISVGRSPTKDNLLVFYLLEQEEWDRACASMVTAGFALVPAYNQYWDRCGKTFEDLDGYRVVLQHGDWSK